ncbi:MAG: hypothetical protein PWP46_1939 [Fusobacteriaceae bacterium]|jgi:O-acetyl-ADP-ribose deacetylase (regulator of RNase III)|nr:hypothetical protein [Fusobacteriales bacterium]MDN5305053.1 hypothetical protein [Fusobacteriaceae bacterium]
MKKQLLIRTVENKDVCEVESDALITAVDSKGIWCGQVDMAIRKNVGDYYHQALLGHIRQKTGASLFDDGQVILVEKDEGMKTAFNNIIFVIDDLTKPLSEIVYNGLVKANEEEYKIVSMSSIRAGESFGKKEKTFEEMAKEVFKGIRKFLNETDEIKINRLLILTYDNEEYKNLLIKEFNTDEDLVAIY